MGSPAMNGDFIVIAGGRVGSSCHGNRSDEKSGRNMNTEDPVNPFCNIFRLKKLRKH